MTRTGKNQAGVGQVLGRALLLFSGCGLGVQCSTGKEDPQVVAEPGTMQPQGPWFAHLGAADGDPDSVRVIQTEFSRRNPGYELGFAGATRFLPASNQVQVVFVHAGTARATVGGTSSEVGLGDVILLHNGQGLVADADLDLLWFRCPPALPADLPAFLRPDWDPRITDVVGGCATEEGAYRRIVLTWLGKNGPYLYHGLNAHRVRIMDSFTHYHPVEGGFDEFYLVQRTRPKARLVTSGKTDRICRPEDVSDAEADTLLEQHPLAGGDLVYIPRGIVHRGVGGVLAHVITVPGFKPGSEIGVDHHLRAINERLGRSGPRALALNEPASHAPVVK